LEGEWRDYSAAGFSEWECVVVAVVSWCVDVAENELYGL
jgi:hypothetical protein